ncbi:MAG TPA: pyridoxal phosphate-dependent aminotransferase family protein [Gemmatimonadaceae bacterium]|nr:pyridoxal phosphate-dependent aminotransferase family protein [Gemmatimonadaceae bacterium]
MTRTAAILPWIAARREAELWPYARAVSTAPGPVTWAEGEAFQQREGLNFATQDYLSLGSHPAVCEAATAAVRRYGVHSGGSSALQGRSDSSRALEREIGDTLHMEHVVLFSSGWGAAFGAVTALVRPDDHVVMDRLAHASLQTGVAAATRNVKRIEHLSVEGLRRALVEIRAGDTSNGILVITEGLFSMDSDSPDLRAMQAVCREYHATLLVDVAHDFGSLGPGGTGHVGREGMLGEIDIVMGAFSKTFASNGGFVATRHAGVRAYVEAYGGPHMFSNAMSPIQVATVREALRIVRSAEGDQRRASLMTAVGTLRQALAERGLQCLGDPSAVVPVLIGDTPVARLAARGVLKRGLFAALVEFPAVGIRAARFRMQVQADHTPEQAREAASLLADAVSEARQSLVTATPASASPLREATGSNRAMLRAS